MFISGQTHHKFSPIDFHSLILHKLHVRIGFTRRIDPEILHDIVDSQVIPVDILFRLNPAILFQCSVVVSLALRACERQELWVDLHAGQSILCVGSKHL
jgi:hypothetical protein